MTYSDACHVPDRTPVRLADGRMGKVLVWFFAIQSLGIVLDDGSLRAVPCERLSVVEAGVLEERD